MYSLADELIQYKQIDINCCGMLLWSVLQGWNQLIEIYWKEIKITQPGKKTPIYSSKLSLNLYSLIGHQMFDVHTVIKGACIEVPEMTSIDLF